MFEYADMNDMELLQLASKGDRLAEEALAPRPCLCASHVSCRGRQ